MSHPWYSTYETNPADQESNYPALVRVFVGNQFNPWTLARNGNTLLPLLRIQKKLLNLEHPPHSQRKLR